MSSIQASRRGLRPAFAFGEARECRGGVRAGLAALSPVRGALLGCSALAAIGLGAVPTEAMARTVADAVFVNGNVIPMTAPDARAQAVAVKDGAIVAVGTNRQIAALQGKKTKRVDLKGKTLLPGFIDAHGHIGGLAQALGTASLDPPPVGTVGSIPELQNVLRQYAASHPQGWVVGRGYDDSLMTEHRHPTRHELDAVAADRPVIASHASGHLAVLNTKALEMAGLLHPGKLEPGSVVQLEADGQTASGVIAEGALFKILGLFPRPTLEQGIAGLAAAQKIYAQNGLTTAQDGATTPDGWRLLSAAADQSALFIDVHALPLASGPFPGLDQLPFNAPYKNRLRAAGIKIIMDGSPQGRTAWLSHPYFHAPHGEPDDYAGFRQIPDEKLDVMLRNAAGHGWQVYAHVNGDAAIQQLIDGVRRTDEAGGPKLKRTIAIHAQTARLDQLKAMKQLDIEPSFFANHTFFWGDWHREVTLGPVRADRISPQRDAFDIGLRPTIHNDAPVVPPNMIRLIWSAVTRRTRSDDILGPQERVTPYEALQEVTSNAAYEIHEESSKGTLEPGKLADFVVLDGDPLTTPPEMIINLRVVGTIKEGRYVFSAEPQPPS